MDVDYYTKPYKYFLFFILIFFLVHLECQFFQQMALEKFCEDFGFFFILLFWKRCHKKIDIKYFNRIISVSSKVH